MSNGIGRVWAVNAEGGDEGRPNGVGPVWIENADQLGSKLPEPESGDAGKVLGVLNSDGDIGWVVDQGGMAQVQSDWDQTDSSQVSYIANKPNLATVATTGAYSDLSGTPTVDQTYDATSTNSQSGTAVAQAIAGISVDEVPAVTSSDDGKILKATYSGGTGSYAWATESGGASYTAGDGIDITSDTISANLDPKGLTITNGKIDLNLSLSGGLSYDRPPTSETLTVGGNSYYNGTILLDNTGLVTYLWASSSDAETFTLTIPGGVFGFGSIMPQGARVRFFLSNHPAMEHDACESYIDVTDQLTLVEVNNETQIGACSITLPAYMHASAGWSSDVYFYSSYAFFRTDGDSNFNGSGNVRATYAGSSLSGLKISNPLPSSTPSDVDKVLTVDSLGVPGWAVIPAQPTGLFEAVYGTTTFADIAQAVTDKRIVYCKVDQGYGQARMAFLAYKSNVAAEFQYYRSISSHSASTQTDEVYIYKVNADGWTTTTRKAGVNVTSGTHMSQSYSNDTLTLNCTWPTVDQIYNAVSTNAQSGVAVASALSRKQDTIGDLSTIRSGADAGSTAVQPSSLATVATTGSYSDLSGKPTIPTVDQTYDATSTNAQSGVAVASAIAHSGLFEATYGTTTLAAIQYAIDAHKIVYCRNADRMAFLAYIGPSQVEFQYYRSNAGSGDSVLVYAVTSSGWTTLERPATVTVDQTYNASSTNAQSGTAVAGALATVRQVPTLSGAVQGQVLSVDGNGGSEWGYAILDVPVSMMGPSDDLANDILQCVTYGTKQVFLSDPVSGYKLPLVSADFNGQGYTLHDRVFKGSATLGSTVYTIEVYWLPDEEGEGADAWSWTSSSVTITNIQQVNALPANPDANTLYLIPEA